MDHNVISGIYGSVHYWIAGQGEKCIVFTHGATMDHGLFQYQVEHFASQFKVIVWDVPMHGCSRPYDGFTLQKAAQELIGILDAESVNKAHLVGQSMGGYIGQLVARDYPERVESLIIVDSSPMQPFYYSKLDNWLLAITPSLLRLYPYKFLISAIAKSIAVREVSQQYALETLKGYSKTEIADIMSTVYQGVQDYQQEEALPVPILIVYGEADRSGKVQTYSKQWAEKEGRSLRVISQASHNSNMDNPDEFNQIVDEFLEKQS